MGWGYPLHPPGYYDDDCECAKTGLYQPECPHCGPRDEDEEYIEAFWDQEVRNG